MDRIIRIIAYYRGRSPVTLLWHHGLLFAAVGTLIVCLRVTWMPWMPLFWPLVIWYVVFSLHFLLVRSLTANDEWADERADKLRRHAYDFQHVKDIYIKPTNFQAPTFPPPEPDQSKK
jgi:hypothetical protein